jgi:hypothetical protein
MSSSSTSTSQSSTAAPACQTPAGAKQTVAIQAGAGSWRVVAEESPTHIGAELARVARRLAELNA